MSHPDSCYDPDNSYEDDDMAYDNVDDSNYDDYNNFYDDAENEDEDVWTDDYDDSMDGDAESAFGSCGWGVDEQYYSDYNNGDDW